MNLWGIWEKSLKCKSVIFQVSVEKQQKNIITLSWKTLIILLGDKVKMNTSLTY